MKTISHLVAVSNDLVIGVDNDLPWNLKDDLAHFKKYTLNKIIIMGRKTYESIGRPLPNRINYVISRTLKKIDGADVFNNLEDAMNSAEKHNKKVNQDNEIIIIGGGYLFKETSSSVNKLVITRVDCNVKGDIYYPKIAKFNIILLMMFPLGLMSGFRHTFDTNPMQALNLFGLGTVLSLVFYFSAYFLYRRFGYENAIISALACGGRNVLLAYTITTPFMGAMFLPLIGAYQLPSFCLPLLGKKMVKWHTIDSQASLK